MAEARDLAIKLFGRTIPLPESQLPPPQAEAEVEDFGEGAAEGPVRDLKYTCKEVSNTDVKDPKADASDDLDQAGHASSSSSTNFNGDDCQISTQEDHPKADTKPEQDQTEADTSGQEKVLKKPDKILPCPRCNSMDTKFCYYNNYNVNQPRHFCKNCQRYWTAGGTMRNVPVGAGRRKNKHSASHYHHIMMSTDGMVANQVDSVEASDSMPHQVLPCGFSAPRPLRVNGTVLKFGSEAPLCESMASVLNLGDQKQNAELVALGCGENMKDPSHASSVSAANCVEIDTSENAVHIEKNGMQNYCNGVTPIPTLQCYSGPPWIYPWNPGWNSVAAMAESQSSSELVSGSDNDSPSPMPWRLPPVMATPALCAPAIPFPFVPTSFWGYMPAWPAGAWNVPWMGSYGVLSPSSYTSNGNSSVNGSPILGKHSRDASLVGEDKAEKSIVVPKTLRIDDLDGAVKSSIWATLGIKPEESSIFKAFQSKVESKDQTSDATQVLHANPAALSRSQSFQEST